MHGCKTTPCSFPNLFRKHTQEKLTSPLQQTASASGSCAKEKVLLWPSLIHASFDCPHSSRKHSCQAFMSSTTLMYTGNTVSQKSSWFLALAILLPPFLCFSWARGGRRYNKDVPFATEHDTNISSMNFELLWAFVFTSAQYKREFLWWGWVFV